MEEYRHECYNLYQAYKPSKDTQPSREGLLVEFYQRGYELSA